MSKITAGGIVATVLYGVSIAWYVIGSGQKIADLELNELGDFLAGVLGPLGFFWLICGYLQQGIELQQNTRALELQVEELKNSVEQQRELVSVTREQVHLEMEEVRRQREVARRAGLPIFSAHGVGGSYSGGAGRLRAPIKNVGADVTSVLFVPPPEVAGFVGTPVQLWARGKDVDIVWLVPAGEKPDDFEIGISYVDRAGADGAAIIKVSYYREESSPGWMAKLSVENPQ
ncbi:hypothetical protein [Stenotrophomonas sp. CFBP 13718]|uniref:hypothetical protein n=1 Tax=Stenotrophomonas sp. CFBP 13718 TaxID=2775304 RepID=UPI00177A8C66|nr:hypothetical protein [Stenotrophomonas sp. CFBP 13718]MBD8696616.1 hypothetical protein [Stenotrophomonas sp. CFBP 13718]